MEILFDLQSSKILVLLLLFLPSTFGKTENWNPTGSGCVDPEGFLSYYDDQLTQLTSCGQVANSTCSDTNTHLQTCLAGCRGAYDASKLGCWLQSCWNEVYSCEYQRTAAEYLDGVDLVQTSVDIPFYPPPPGSLPGGCSCNIGYVYGNLSGTPENHCMQAALTGDQDVFAECTCCQSSWVLSNVFSACPKSDLQPIFLINDDIAKFQAAAADRTPDQCAILDHSDSAEYCANTYGVVEFADKVYNPLNFPSGIPGTETISNLPGTAFTTFTSVLTLALDPGFSTTITPATYNQKNAEKTSSGGDGGSTGAAATGTGSTGVSSTGTGTSTSATPTGSGVRLGSSFGALVAGYVTYILALHIVDLI